MGGGEAISSPSVTSHREAVLLVFALAAAGGLAALNLHRAGATLHWLLVLALLPRFGVGLLLALQLSSALLDARMPANGAVPADVAYLERTCTTRAMPTLQATTAAATAMTALLCSLTAHLRHQNFRARCLRRGWTRRSGTRSRCACSPPRLPNISPPCWSSWCCWPLPRVATSCRLGCRSARRGVSATFVLYFTDGVVQIMRQHVLCSIFVLCFQVVRILLVFAVMVFLNSTSEAFRRQSGHQWRLQADLTRIICYRNLRFRVMVFLILPIVFMFFEVVLDWQVNLRELSVHITASWGAPARLTTRSPPSSPQPMHHMPLRKTCMVDCSAAVS